MDFGPFQCTAIFTCKMFRLSAIASDMELFSMFFFFFFFNDCFVCIVHSLWNFSSLIRDPAQAWQWKYRFLTTDCQGIVCNIKNTSIPASPGGSGGKESAYNTGDQGFNPRVGKIHRSSKWQPIPVCLPGEFHGTEKPGWLQSMRSQWARH